MAITDTGGTVTAWKGSGGTFTSLFSSADSTFSNGYAGIDGAGNISRSAGFRAGKLTSLAEQLALLPTLDSLKRTESPLSNEGKWSALAWDESTSTVKTGRATTSGWGFDGSPSHREELFSRSAGGDGLFLYRTADGRLNFTVNREAGDKPTARTDEVVSSGEWHHVVASIEQYFYCPNSEPGPFHEPELILYVDGFAYPVEVSYAFPAATPTAHNLVGVRQTASGLTNFLQGTVDDVSIYTDALTEEEVQSHLAISDAEMAPAVLLPPIETTDTNGDGVGDACESEE